MSLVKRSHTLRPCYRSSPPLEYQVLEISTASDGHFIISESKSLKVIPAWKPFHGVRPIFYRSLVALPVMENAVVVWDYERNEYAVSGVTFWDARAFGVSRQLCYCIRPAVLNTMINSCL